MCASQHLVTDYKGLWVHFRRNGLLNLNLEWRIPAHDHSVSIYSSACTYSASYVDGASNPISFNLQDKHFRQISSDLPTHLIDKNGQIDTAIFQSTNTVDGIEFKLFNIRLDRKTDNSHTLSERGLSSLVVSRWWSPSCSKWNSRDEGMQIWSFPSSIYFSLGLSIPDQRGSKIFGCRNNSMDCGFNLLRKAAGKQPNKEERDLVLPAIVSRFDFEVTLYCLCDMGMKTVNRYIQVTSISIFMKACMMPRNGRP